MPLIKKIVNGIAIQIEYIFYPSTQRISERVISADGIIPESVKEITRQELPVDMIHNQEYQQYIHHSRLLGL